MKGKTPSNFNPLNGKKFGKLSVLKRASKPKHLKDDHARTYWLCLCECGKQDVFRSDQLLLGRAKSCGCSRGHDLLGERFGKLRAVARAEKPKHIKSELAYWLLECTCGNTVVKSGYALRNGQCQDHCGCEGDGRKNSSRK